MTAKEYADKLYDNYPTYHKIAMDGFKAGMKNAKPANVQKLETDLKRTKQELNQLWDTINDPEQLGNLLAGM